MIKKEMVAMLLAGGQGSRLGVLTQTVAKPAVSFGGKYRIIDFPLIGIGIPWDLDRAVGGVTLLAPYESAKGSDWYSGTANAIYQNIEYIDSYHPDYVLILSGDHIYKMDYEVMLDFHKANRADLTVAVMPVPIEEASRFGVMITDETNRIVDFEEKPKEPKSNLASMGIYIFSWPVLKEALLRLREVPELDFGKHVIPYCRDKGKRLFAYEFHGYWKDVGTLSSYWEANMELVDIVPEFNLYEEYWRIFTKSDFIPPQYLGEHAKIEGSLIGEGCEIYGEVHHSVIGAGVVIEEGTVVRDSIIMRESVIGAGAKVTKSILAEQVVVGKNSELGVGEYRESSYDRRVYNSDLVTVGENTVIPSGVKIGKNTAVWGETVAADYPNGMLESGGAIIKAGGLK